MIETESCSWSIIVKKITDEGEIRVISTRDLSYPADLSASDAKPLTRYTYTSRISAALHTTPIEQFYVIFLSNTCPWIEALRYKYTRKQNGAR